MADKNAASQEKLEGTEIYESSSIKGDNEETKQESDNSSSEKDLSSKENFSAAEESLDPKPVAETNLSEDAASKITSPESSLPSTEDVSDGDFSSMSSSSDEKSVSDKPSKDANSKKITFAENPTELSRSGQEPISDKMSYRSLFTEHSFSSDDDSGGWLKVEKYQSILDTLLEKPKEIDVSKVVKQSRKRQRSIFSGKNSPSKSDGAESSNRNQQDSSSTSVSYPPTPFPSSESSQDVEEPVATSGPTEFSCVSISNVESHKTEATSDKAENFQTEPSVVVIDLSNKPEEPVTVISPKEFSPDGISIVEPHKTEATSNKAEGVQTGPAVEQMSLERSSNKKSDPLSILKYDASKAIKECCEAIANKGTTSSSNKKSSTDPLSILKYDPSRALKQSSGASTSKSSVDSLSILKYDPSRILNQSIEKTIAKCNRPHVSRCSEEAVRSPVPIQTPRDVILAENLCSHPHERRVNSLTSLTDRLVDFTNYMAANPLLTIPSGTSSGAAALPFTPDSLRELQQLQAAFRVAFEALQDSSSDSDDMDAEDDACDNGFRQSVRDIKNYLRVLIDGTAYSDSDMEETVPPSEEPTTLEELQDALPRLWRNMGFNNMIMSQWTSTLLDWCLAPVPEYLPQQFYDCEQGVRSLYGRIDDVRRSTARLMYRWRNRRMDYDELGDLTYLMTMASTAMSMYSVIESEVINLRYVMGTRHTLVRQNRRRQRPNTDQYDSDDSVSAKRVRKSSR